MSYSILSGGQRSCFHRYIKAAVFSATILFMLSACGQRSASPESKSEEVVVSKDEMAIIRSLTEEACECATSAMRGGGLPESIDSCFDVMLARHEASLKQAGLNSQTQEGKDKIRDHFAVQLGKSCPVLFQDEQGKILTFTGMLVSQKKLQSGLFEITMKDNATQETRKFFAKNPLNEKEIQKYEPGYNITVEYEIVKNRTTNKEEFHVKESAAVMTVGAVKVGD